MRHLEILDNAPSKLAKATLSAAYAAGHALRKERFQPFIF